MDSLRINYGSASRGVIGDVFAEPAPTRQRLEDGPSMASGPIRTDEQATDTASAHDQADTPPRTSQTSATTPAPADE